MHRLQDEVRALLRQDGVVARRDHPDLSGAIDWLVRRQQLCRVLPGVYAPLERADELRVRAAAVARWSPDAVIIGGAAARMTFWPAAPMDAVEVATTRAAATAASGWWSASSRRSWSWG